ncbi:Selenocysteine insertion sequence-binding protein 2 [Orobanche hederae]
MDPNNMQHMMSSYLKIKKLVDDNEEEEEEEEEETDSDGEEDEREDDCVERESAARVTFVESRLKKKKMSIGEGGSGRRSPAAGRAVVAPPYCLVENCRADLTGSKKYHQRHRVCEVHAKAPVVFIDGFGQRFCQQCSRFHELSEFDQTKRSCRRRLAGHNERRRKSSLESQKDSGSTTRLEGNHCRHLNQHTKIGNQDFNIHSSSSH